MDIWIVISLLSLVVSSVAVGLSIKGRTRIEHVAAVTGAAAIRETRDADIFLTEFMAEIRGIGQSSIHLHDIEVIGKKVLKKLR